MTYIGHLGNVINKAKLFDNNLTTNPVSRTGVMNVLVDFGQKKEEILNNLRSLFEGLEAAQALPLELVPKFFMDTQ